MDKVFNQNIHKQLMDKSYSPILPLQLKANRSVLVFRVDNYIFMHNEAEIMEEIIYHNEWVEEINQVYKFPNSNTLKISFNETAKALRAQEQGLKCFP